MAPEAKRVQVSVLTTVFNGMPYLPEAVQSVLNQTLREFEYVIVDDGSDDDTGLYLRSLRDPRVRVVSLPRSGRGTALNAGLTASRADLIAILDADDVASPRRLELQCTWMREHPDLSVLASSCSLRLGDLFDQSVSHAPLRPIAPREFIRGNPICHSGVIMTRAAVCEVGGYDERRTELFDYDLWLKLAEKKHVFGKVSLPLVYKRIHKDQRFERGNVLRYLCAGFRERTRALRLFSGSPMDRLYPLAGFAFGLLPLRFRRRLFRLSCE